MNEAGQGGRGLSWYFPASVLPPLPAYSGRLAAFDNAEAAFKHFRNVTNIPAKVSKEFAEKFGGLDADGFPE